MIKKEILYILSIVLLFYSCATYTTFYSKTYHDITLDKPEKIHRLDISNKNLKELPDILDHIKDLRMVNLSNNPELDVEITLEKLSIHKNLEVLILDSLDILTIPKTIQRFHNLKQISLVNNPNLNPKQVLRIISELPIEFLNLQHNKLTSLPENITDLTELKDLNLAYNKIHDSNTYTFLGKLPKLYSLWIDHNELKELPKTIGKLDQIRFLYIGHNKLKNLPDQLTQMKKLWVIHAGYNEFSILPTVFTGMRSLLMVHINNNKIHHIPEVFETEKYPLAGLILDNNVLSSDEIEKGKKIFNSFFLLSFQQKKY